jgi:DNA-binding transcriptional LysR family regulator
MREDVLYVSADAERLLEPMTIERLAAAPLILFDARFGADDPMRRQLRERAQQAGVKLEPQIEVEYVTAALELCARGLGDTVTSQQMIRARGLARRLAGVRFDPPLYDTFAFITRRNAHLSPASREFMRLAEKRVRKLAPQLA